MKTTIDIPDGVFSELLENTQAKTKKDAILTAIKDFNRKQRMAAMTDMLGTFEDFLDQDDLEASRNAD